jgi:hypothetical protein
MLLLTVLATAKSATNIAATLSGFFCSVFELWSAVLGYRAKSQYHNLRQFFSYIVDA